MVKRGVKSPTASNGICPLLHSETRHVGGPGSPACRTDASVALPRIGTCHICGGAEDAEPPGLCSRGRCAGSACGTPELLPRVSSHCKCRHLAMFENKFQPAQATSHRSSSCECQNSHHSGSFLNSCLMKTVSVFTSWCIICRCRIETCVCNKMYAISYVFVVIVHHHLLTSGRNCIPSEPASCAFPASPPLNCFGMLSGPLRWCLAGRQNQLLLR